MDNPVQPAARAVKRVPKWAWIAGIGVTGGILFYRWRNRGTVSTAASASDATAPGDYGQTYNPGIVTAAPVVGASDGAAYSYPTGGIPVDQLPDILSLFTTTQPQPMNPVDLINSVLPYVGGGAPVSDTTSAPPAPAAAAPPPPPPPPAPAPPPPDPCPGSTYPFQGPHGCYKVVCASGKGDHAAGRWHFYQSGLELHVAATC
jgi:hypothetical protein